MTANIEAQIREEYLKDPEIRQIDLANKFGISQSTVSRIVQTTREYWEGKKHPNGRRQPGAKLNYQVATEIRHLRRTEGYTYLTLATMYGVSETTIAQIIRNKYWRNEPRAVDRGAA